MRLVLAFALTVLAATLPLASAAPEEPPVSDPPRATPPTVADLSWLAGTWRGTLEAEDGVDVVEETWGEPIGSATTGVFRWMHGDRVYLYELIVLEQDADGVAMHLRHFGAGLTPYPSEADGPMTWRLAAHDGREAVFASDRYAFPRRLVYRRPSDDALVVRLEGERDGTPAEMEFRFRRR